MPGTLTLGNMSIPYDEEIFSEYFADEPDLMSDALVKCGAMVEDNYINSLIAGGGDLYTVLRADRLRQRAGELRRQDRHHH